MIHPETGKITLSLEFFNSQSVKLLLPFYDVLAVEDDVELAFGLPDSIHVILDIIRNFINTRDGKNGNLDEPEDWLVLCQTMRQDADFIEKYVKQLYG